MRGLKFVRSRFKIRHTQATSVNHAGTLKKTVKVCAPPGVVWRRISDIAGLPAWAAGVKKTTYLSKKRRGVGAVRLITFEDASRVEEHVTSWKTGESYTYIATSGLPVRAYVASISIRGVRGGTKITWQSYTSVNMTRKEFAGFLDGMGSFYDLSLCNLKKLLETKV
ncbi:MAG: SRPBCC family protein [Nitrosopumilus sp. B06]|nr:MAG: SRPBCC family protein [Nitrosopumilus sp. B06]